jgi:hypothetical protein
MRPRPLFEVNEDVIIKARCSSGFNGPARIAAVGDYCEYQNMDGEEFPAEWGYWIHGVEFQVAECSLRKLPPEATDEDFERFMDKLDLPHLIPAKEPVSG